MNIWVIAVLSLLATSILAQEITVWAEKFPPYGYEDETGKIVGISTEIVQYIIKDTGLKAGNWEIAPWNRAFKMTQRIPNSVLYTVVRKPNREDMFHWIGPISDRNQYIYKLRSRKDIVVNSIDDAKKYNLGAVMGTAITDLLITEGLKPREVYNHDETVKLLLHGRLDLIVHLDYSLAYIAKGLGVEFSTFEPVLLVDGSKKYYIVINKNSSPSIIEKFQASFKKLVHSGGLSEIQQKYLQ